MDLQETLDNDMGLFDSFQKTTTPTQSSDVKVINSGGGKSIYGGQYLQGSNPQELFTSLRGYGGVPTKKGNERDHIFPVSLGGTSNAKNIVYRPEDQARLRDNVEKYAASQLKKGKIDLSQARAMVLAWDYTDIPGQPAYEKRFGGKLFDTTSVGQTLNFIKATPGSIFQVGKNILQGIFQNITSAGLSLMGDITRDKGFEKVEVPKQLQGIIGEKEIDNLQTRIANREIAIKQSPVAQKLGLDKYALPLSFGSVVGSAGLDLSLFASPGRSAAKEILDNLAKETNPEIITNILTHGGISDDIARQFAPKIADLTKPGEVEDALKLLKDTDGLAQIAEKTSQTTASEAGNVAKASGDINAKIVTRGFEELPEELLAKYTPITKKEQIDLVSDLIKNNYEFSKNIAKGVEKSPENISSQVVFNAVKNKAIAESDVNTLRDLASSPVATERSLAAQKLGASGFDNGLKESDPVAAIQEIKAARAEAAVKRVPKLKQVMAKDVTELSAHIKKAAPTKETWSSFIDSIKC